MSRLVDFVRALTPGRLGRVLAERRAWELSSLADAMEKSGMGDRITPTAAEVRSQAEWWRKRAMR